MCTAAPAAREACPYEVTGTSNASWVHPDVASATCDAVQFKAQMMYCTNRTLLMPVTSYSYRLRAGDYPKPVQHALSVVRTGVERLRPCTFGLHRNLHPTRPRDTPSTTSWASQQPHTAVLHDWDTQGARKRHARWSNALPPLSIDHFLGMEQ